MDASVKAPMGAPSDDAITVRRESADPDLALT
jgi:hypothetical protein